MENLKVLIVSYLIASMCQIPWQGIHLDHATSKEKRDLALMTDRPRDGAVGQKSQIWWKLSNKIKWFELPQSLDILPMRALSSKLSEAMPIPLANLSKRLNNSKEKTASLAKIKPSRKEYSLSMNMKREMKHGSFGANEVARAFKSPYGSRNRKDHRSHLSAISRVDVDKVIKQQTRINHHNRKLTKLQKLKQ